MQVFNQNLFEEPQKQTNMRKSERSYVLILFWVPSAYLPVLCDLGLVYKLIEEPSRMSVFPIQRMIHLSKERRTVPAGVPAWTNASRFHLIASWHLLITFPRGSPSAQMDLMTSFASCLGRVSKCSHSSKSILVPLLSWTCGLLCCI